jgi:hypothetical protein
MAAAVATVTVMSFFGRAVAARLFPDVGHPLLIGPAIGLGLHIVLLVPLALLVGLSVPLIIGVLIANVALAWWLGPPSERMSPGLLAFVAASLVVAAWPAATAMPHITGNGVFIGETIFDRGKVPIGDEIARNGIFARNPYFGGPNGAERLVYYYLWYVPFAELRLLFGISGWAADIALTWVTAYCSLALMGAIAIRLTGSIAVAWWVLPLSLCGTLRPLQSSWFGDLSAIFHEMNGLNSWPMQAGWVPHHVLSATLTVLTTLMVWQIASASSRQAPAAAAAGLLVAAALGCSTWVGGFVQPVLLATVVAVGLLVHRSRSALRPAVGNVAIAGVVAIAFAVPLVLPQLAVVGARKLVKFVLYPVFVPDLFGDSMWTEVLGYWTVLLPTEFGAIYVGGLLGLLGTIVAARRTVFDPQRALPVWLALAILPLLMTEVLRSSIANNDLGWRVIIVSQLVLTGWGAATLRRLFQLDRRALVACIPLVLMLASLPAGITWLSRMSIPSLDTRPMTEHHRAFARDPEVWAAVRRHTPPQESILNNARSRDGVTPWPGNIGWALLSDRRSCIGGWEWLRAYTQIRHRRLVDIVGLSERFFSGDASAADEARLQEEFGCRTLLITPEDGVWRHRSLASPEQWRLVEEEAGRWRIYRAVGAAGLPKPRNTSR